MGALVALGAPAPWRGRLGVAGTAADRPRRQCGGGRKAASASTCDAGQTTGALKLVAIPAYGFVRETRSLSGALLVGLAANVLNQLDTRPGRALKAYLAAGRSCFGAPLVPGAVLLAPYDLREMAMLGDAGSNALGAMLGLNSVKRFTARGRWAGDRRACRPHPPR